MKLTLVVHLALLGSVLSTIDVSINDNDNNITIEDMQSVFERSDELHKASMAKMMESMTVDKAVASLESSEFAKSQVVEVKKMVQQGGSLRQPKGYNALDGARNLLNSMIHESFEKYDKEVMDCVDYYAKQCALLYECR